MWLIRILLSPVTLLILLLTAIFELLGRGDWDFWRDFNKGIIKNLPFGAGRLFK